MRAHGEPGPHFGRPDTDDPGEGGAIGRNGVPTPRIGDARPPPCAPLPTPPLLLAIFLVFRLVLLLLPIPDVSVLAFVLAVAPLPFNPPLAVVVLLLVLLVAAVMLARGVNPKLFAGVRRLYKLGVGDEAMGRGL